MTELIWDGKYKDGKKVTPVRIALPFQTIETINESSADREKRLGSLFQQKEETTWRNRLIWGDKKYVLPSLLPEFAGKINLIYIDPPFNVGADFSFTAKIADDPETEYETAEFVKQPSIIEQKAYRDTWGKGLDSYMQWFYETALFLKELLASDGSLYVHLDWHIGHYAKAVLDEVFGYENFQREVIWAFDTKSGFKTIAKNWIRSHDTIYYYSKSKDRKFNKQYGEYDPKYLKRFKHIDEDGRRYRDDRSGGRRQYIDESKGVQAADVWKDIKSFQQDATLEEYLQYDTQKPESLLTRVLSASSNEGDLVLDCFCGSGTTAAVAEKLNRRWITCDLGRFAIHTARKRLLGIDNVKPFVVQNLGKYERQQWMDAEWNADTLVRNEGEARTTASPEEPGMRTRVSALRQEREYRHFIVELYHAKSLDGYTWLHGAKAGRMVHVGSVDAPVTVEDIKAAIKEFWKMAGGESEAASNGIDFLGWDFAFDVNETAAHFANANNVNASFKKIPREVLEKKAVEQGDIKFYELASLGVKVKTGKKQIEVSLTDFIIPPDDVPEEVRGKITHWSQWIDYWAVDWNYRGDTFHNEWQSYRTKKEPKIDLTARNTDVKPGKYTVLVKVIDILGNDTTKAVEVEV